MIGIQNARFLVAVLHLVLCHQQYATCYLTVSLDMVNSPDPRRLAILVALFRARQLDELVSGLHNCPTREDATTVASYRVLS